MSSVSLVKFQRLLVLAIIMMIYSVISMFIKYISTLFIAFCVVYTLQDIYKHRRKYMWCLHMAHRTLIIAVEYGLGEEYLKYVMPAKRKRNIKKK
jgi:predicted PurR-regulated permease PerM